MRRRRLSGIFVSMDRDLHISAQLLERYDRPGPRYTSYPTAVEFHGGFTAREYADHLHRVAAGEPVSLYVHLPFCRRRCSYCGCHAIVPRRREEGSRYLESVERELARLARELPPRTPLIQLHLGGGTPTYFHPDQLSRLYEQVERHWRILPQAEMAVEIDPRATSREHIDRLISLGFNRLSMGVQDFDPKVQRAIGRDQQEAQTVELYEYCRSRGFGSINIDLIYGLPGQTTVSFGQTLESVLALRPARVALYSYAHVPWIKPHQQRIDTRLLPRGMAKLELFAQALEAFLGHGYEQIGMDHFALPEDELSRARAEHRLYRNFMGYTVHRATIMLGAGISGIGDVKGAYVQNRKDLNTYYEEVGKGELPVERGYVLSRDDQIRRHVITELMCNGILHLKDVEARYDICFGSYFERELSALRAGPERDGLVESSTQTLRATDLGRLFIRNICMTFDRYTSSRQGSRPAFSRTV